MGEQQENEMDDQLELELKKSAALRKKEAESGSAHYLLSFLENIDKFMTESGDKNFPEKAEKEQKVYLEKLKHEEKEFKKQVEIEEDISFNEKNNQIFKENLRVTETSGEEYTEKLNQEEPEQKKQVEVEVKDIFSVKKSRQVPIRKEQVDKSDVQSESKVKTVLADKKNSESKDLVIKDDHELVRSKIINFLEKKAIDEGKLKKVVPVIFNKERK